MIIEVRLSSPAGRRASRPVQNAAGSQLPVVDHTASKALQDGLSKSAIPKPRGIFPHPAPRVMPDGAFAYPAYATPGPVSAAPPGINQKLRFFGGTLTR